MGHIGALPYIGSACATQFNPSGKEDAKTLAHELGHNLNVIHTHNQGLDTCVEKGCGDSGSGLPFADCAYVPCPGEVGTLMSYCHACEGGLGSTSKFHEKQVESMKKYVLEYQKQSSEVNEKLELLLELRRRNLGRKFQTLSL